MFDWLFEGWLAIYLLLATVFVGLLYFYWQSRHKGWLYAMLGVFALIGVYALLDRLVETDREQLERKIKAMADGLTTHNLDAVFENIDDQFKSPAGLDKKGFRQLADNRIHEVSEVRVRNFDFKTTPERGKEFTGLRFMFKVRGVPGADDIPFDCEPVFEYDPAKGWRVTRFRIYKFGTTEEMPAQF